ncbi:tctex1 domain-containing protein 1-B [Strongylocentrotus purpuratus]|uniref:Uncharacterized protein n=1 Tax=Strongylocentrotus purpuratus TaxID=7668 RepID=A0A7M7RB06_STRPU|nr:tctex1 domain-containing protein 1-B [Strongylocentrotus purpuratus]|eukprot:XP_011680479.1 PREDICTED: tctex1 domain-containing protein 1-B [Strongylocentrotus purpuratus]
MSSDKQDVARSKAAKLLKRHGSASSLMSGSEFGARIKPAGSVSTVSFIDEPHDSSRHGPVRLEPTYQLGPVKKFPVTTVKSMLKETMEGYLQDKRYEPEWCKKMTKTISDDLKAQVKDLMLPRYKIIVLVHIGQLQDQGLKVSSRCLWDSSNDTSASYEFRNSSLFAAAMVYGVYYE